MRLRRQSSETTAASKVATVAQPDGKHTSTQRDEQASIPISWALIIVVSFSICIRAAISLSPYSGKLTHLASPVHSTPSLSSISGVDTSTVPNPF